MYSQIKETMSTLTRKDFKSQSVYGNQVDFFMQNETTVYVNLDDQTVINEDEMVSDEDYAYFIQAAQEVIAEKEERDLEASKYNTLQYYS